MRSVEEGLSLAGLVCGSCRVYIETYINKINSLLVEVVLFVEKTELYQYGQEW